MALRNASAWRSPRRGRFSIIAKREYRDQRKQPGDAAQNIIGMREADGVVQIPGQRRVNRGGDGGDE